MAASILYETLKTSLPPERKPESLTESDRLTKESDFSVIILDDDPTGTQTVHGVPVITEWSVEAIAAEFRQKTPAFFILTNSRSLSEDQAGSLANRIGLNIREAAEQCERKFRVISRSDSTLRGHYPIELERLEAPLYQEKVVHVIIPAFIEAGRVTVEGIHYVRDADALIPVAETPFASDHAFGFKHSRLGEWVVEKTRGGKQEGDILHIPLAIIRQGGVPGVLARLDGIQGQTVVTVDAFSYSDLDIVAEAFRIAESRGKSFLYRTGASFVRSYAGVSARGLWEPTASAEKSSSGGVIIVGSYVPLSSRQLSYLCNNAGIQTLELLLDADQNPESLLKQAQGISLRVEELISSGADVVIHTSRKWVRKGDVSEELEFGQAVSHCLVKIIADIQTKPGFLIAKGGITSSDVATKALGVRRAMVLGQLLPGVPVWLLGPESKFPGMPYFIFPGNVGGETSLFDAYRILKGNG